MRERDKRTLRTFETRLLWIKEVFEALYPKDQIMTSCINHKLNKSYYFYVDELKDNVGNLEYKDPIKVLNQIKEL